MSNFFKRFAQDESGAVTVDYVVLTAAIVGLSIAVAGAVYPTIKQLAANTNGALTTHGTAVDVALPAAN